MQGNSYNLKFTNSDLWMKYWSFVTLSWRNQMHSVLHRQIILDNKLWFTCHAYSQLIKLLVACWLLGNTFTVFALFALVGLLVHANFPSFLKGRNMYLVLHNFNWTICYLLCRTVSEFRIWMYYYQKLVYYQEAVESMIVHKQCIILSAISLWESFCYLTTNCITLLWTYLFLFIIREK